ncbi:MAG: hypothetical protein L0H73_12795, partial [Nitrococcus sp.]|nr:hypothetical protein [Nitrococcus sp.]
MNTRHRQRNRKSCDDARAAWRAQLAAAARDPGLRAQLAQRERELFPRFAQQYRRLIALPRRARRALQRKWRRSLAAMALLLALGQGPALAATITVDGAAGCTLADAITAANTDTATGDLTLRQTTIRGGNVTLSGDTLCRRSTAFGEGGGVRNFGTLTVLNSTISGNAAVEGGGVFNCGGRVTITGSTVSGNAANGASGPFGATGTGGGVSSLGGTLIIADSTVSGNSAGNGGGIASNPSAGETTLIRNSSISGNTASQAGGSVFIGDGLAEIEHGTITGNTAPPPTNFSVGGGVAVVSDVRTEVRASIISGNASTDVDVVYGTTNSFVSGNFNVIGDGNATAAFNASGDVTGVADPSLGPLADNPPGDTRTHALLTGSPAIDRVNDGTCPPPDEDQRGVGRPQDGNGDGGPACDSGAYELQSAEPMCDGKVATIVG